MSDLKILSDELASYAGDMAPYIVEKAFRDMKLHGDNIPPTMRLKIVDMILERIVFDRNRHYDMWLELLQSLNGLQLLHSHCCLAPNINEK